MPRSGKVLFICEHGNVKSVMAAAYFNQLAARKGLSVRAIARGTDPDSDKVPGPVAEGLGEDGLEVGKFRPAKVTAADLKDARRVICLNLPVESLPSPGGIRAETWNDIPPATQDFRSSRAAILRRIEALIASLAPRH
ncbi:MAG: hypothetical protein HY823_04710 [Acidobacteria bacterium]|nr:hypothetical protein [Acidobacteriota bacterium]